MTQSRAWRTVCDAALLDDTQAKALLCEKLAALEAINGESVHVANTLLAALAWLDPELARSKVATLHKTLSPEQLYFFSQGKVLIDWQMLLPIARQWRDNPALASTAPYKISPVAIYTLATLGRESDIDPLVSLLRERVQLRAEIIGIEAAAIFKALDVLEQHDLLALRELLPRLIDVVAAGVGDHASIVTAKILALAEKYALELTRLLQKLVERILGEISARTARRWTRTLSWALRTLYPEAASAYRGAQDLRILALSRTVIAGLTSKASLRPQEEPRLRLCWRWLGRSEALIASVSHADWQADLLHRKARMENQVLRSRKARHRALIQ